MNYLKDIARWIELKDDDSLKDCLRDGKLMLARQIPMKRPQDMMRMMKKDSSVAAYMPSLQIDRLKLVGKETILPAR